MTMVLVQAPARVVIAARFPLRSVVISRGSLVGTVLDSQVQVSQTDVVLGRQSAGNGGAEEIACPAFGRSLIACASAAAAQILLGFAAAATTLAGYGITDAYTKTAADARYQPIDSDLTAIAALSAGGIAVQTGVGTWAQRSVAGTLNRIAVANGSGVAANPTIDIDAAYVGQGTITTLGTIASGIWNAGAVTSSSAISGTTLTSTVATGTAPLTVTSTTQVNNLNVSQLIGATWAAPGAIGGTTPAAGTFTPLTLGSGATQVILQCDTHDILSQRNGANAQTLLLYNTFTDLSNYERGSVGWSGSTFTITTGNLGTGSARNMSVGPSGAANLFLATAGTTRWTVTSAALQTGLDNTYDIGTAGAVRPRNIFVAGGVGLKVKAGALVDGDFTNPTDGFLAADSTNSKLWVRLGGVWKSVAVA